MTANDRQEGGSHYQTGGLQHWDLVVNHNIEYLPGCASKYLVRWRKKNGAADLRKALHYVDKMIEVYTPAPRDSVPRVDIETVCAAYDLPSVEVAVITLLLNHRNIADLAMARTQIARMLATVSPGSPDDGGHHAQSEVTIDKGSIIASRYDTKCDSCGGTIREGEYVLIYSIPGTPRKTRVHPWCDTRKRG